MNTKFFNRLMLSGAASAFAMALTATAHAEAQEFDIAAQDLSTALLEFGEQSGVNVAAPRELVRDKRAPAVRGEMEPEEALQKILSGSGLQMSEQSGGGYSITLASAEVESPEPFRVAQLDQEDDVRGVASDEEGRTDPERREDVIVVTGTSIRGVVPDSAPVDVFTDLDIARSGAVTVDQFVAKLPQNFNGISTNAPGAAGLAGIGRNSVDFRGLGSGTTLVLLNGKRLVAPGGSSPDISLIPLSAVDRIEVLADGASAQYGSDAVGGVMNIILKDDVDGVETGVSYGTVTSGDHRQLKADIRAGTNWSTGRVSASYDFFDQTELEADDRSVARDAGRFSLLPEDERHSGLVSFQQDFGAKVSARVDAVYSERTFGAVFTESLTNELTNYDIDQEQLFISGQLTYEIGDKFNFDLIGTYSEEDGGSSIARIDLADGTLGDPSFTTRAGDDLEFSAKIDGSLLELPAGDLKFAAGGGYGEESYLNAFSRQSGRGNREESISRERLFAFGEVFVPLISPEQSIPGVHRLEVNAAARFTDFSDFGSNTSPRVGVLWSPVSNLNLRATYAESFRAPNLNELQSANNANFLFAPSDLGFPDPFSTDNSTVYLFAQGSNNPNLAPELSESFTVGFDLNDAIVDGLEVSATYFNIDYQDRIAEPDATNGFAALGNPDLFPSLFTQNPTQDQISGILNGSTTILNTTGVDASDPAAVANIVTVSVDNRIQNVAGSKVDGLDLSFLYETDSQLGSVSVGGNATYLFQNDFLLVSGTPIIENLNRPTQPVDLRIRGFLGLSSGNFDTQAIVNYVDSYSDPSQIPEADISSFTTVDFTLGYTFDVNEDSFLNGTSVSLSVINLFDQDPPFVDRTPTANFALNDPVGFDPTNANALGRFIQFGIRKKW